MFDRWCAVLCGCVCQYYIGFMRKPAKDSEMTERKYAHAKSIVRVERSKL